MKKIILILTVFVIQPIVFAEANGVILDKIENSIYGFTYNDSEQNRVSRIEKSVYGTQSNDKISNRIAKLKKDLSADLIGQEITPTEDTFADPEDSYVALQEPEENSSVDYPVVNELEKQVFNKEFKSEGLKARLSKLETKTFGKTYEQEDLSTRVDRLRAELKPKTFTDNKMAMQENSFYDENPGRMAENYHLDSYGDPFDYDDFNSRFNNSQVLNDDYQSDYMQEPSVFKPSKKLNISTIEKTLYKTKYENEPMDQRLSRIESSVFGSVFANESESERLARISSAINAQKSAKRYDSNKFGQNISTAFQIGTLILMVLACIL